MRERLYNHKIILFVFLYVILPLVLFQAAYIKEKKKKDENFRKIAVKMNAFSKWIWYNGYNKNGAEKEDYSWIIKTL